VSETGEVCVVVRGFRFRLLTDESTLNASRVVKWFVVLCSCLRLQAVVAGDHLWRELGRRQLAGLALRRSPTKHIVSVCRVRVDIQAQDFKEQSMY
jgi:hypothetical protein